MKTHPMTREEIARVIAQSKSAALSEAIDAFQELARETEAFSDLQVVTVYLKHVRAVADSPLAKLHQDAGNGEQGPREQAARQDRLIDSAYAAGLQAGWNLCISDDGEELSRCIEQRIVGHREAIEKARAADALERAERDQLASNPGALNPPPPAPGGER